MNHLLSTILFLPLIGAIAVFLMPHLKAQRYAALLFSSITFITSIPLFTKFSSASADFQFSENLAWIKEYGIRYHLGIDGISLFLVLLTTFITPFVIAFSNKVEIRIKEFLAALLILETAILGTFMSLDLALFYIFFESTLIPLYLLIGIWGGKDRNFAANKFFVYTFLGSLFMLVGIVYLSTVEFKLTGIRTFDISAFQQDLANGMHLSLTEQWWLFSAFALAFGIKAAIFPFHTWMRNTYAESPTAALVLSSVMMKMGTYGLLRFCLPLFPEAVQIWAPWIMGLAVISILYGAAIAAVQKDLRGLLAFSSISHLGFIFLGLFSLNKQGITGSVLQSVNHSISTGALLLLGGLLYNRRKSYEFDDFGGLKSQVPFLAALMLIVMLSSAALPGTNGFIGEFLCLLGAYGSPINSIAPKALTCFAVLGVILSAVYLLIMYQRIFYGKLKSVKNRAIKDLTLWETAGIGAFVVLILALGIYPKIITDKLDKSVDRSINQALNKPGERPPWLENQPFVLNQSPTKSIKAIRPGKL